MEASVRPIRQIQTGDLLAWDSDRYTGWSKLVISFIRVMTLSEYGHVGVAFVDNGKVFVLEAVNPKVRIQPISAGTKLYVVSMNLRSTESLQRIMQGYLGCQYSIMDCIRAYLGLTTKRDDNWQCAELANDVYQQLGVELKPKRVTPSGMVHAALQFSQSNLWIY